MFSLVPTAGCVCSNVSCRQQIQMQRRPLQPWNFDSQWCFQECRVSILILWIPSITSLNSAFVFPFVVSNLLKLCSYFRPRSWESPGRQTLPSWAVQLGCPDWLSLIISFDAEHNIFGLLVCCRAKSYWLLRSDDLQCQGTLMKFLKSLVLFAWVRRNFWLFAFHSKFPHSFVRALLENFKFI